MVHLVYTFTVSILWVKLDLSPLCCLCRLFQVVWLVFAAACALTALIVYKLIGCMDCMYNIAGGTGVAQFAGCQLLTGVVHYQLQACLTL